jgi:hypothetical protein
MTTPDNQEMQAQALRLHKKGWSLKAISRTLGVPKAKLREWLPAKPPLAPTRPKSPLYWTPQRIVEALRAWLDDHEGVPPTSGDWEKVDGTVHPGYETVRRTFGSWEAALLAAGVSVEDKLWRRRFSYSEARALRRQGLSDLEIGERLGVSGAAICQALGSRQEFFAKPPKLKTKEEREEALKRAVENEEQDRKYLSP